MDSPYVVVPTQPVIETSGLIDLSRVLLLLMQLRDQFEWDISNDCVSTQTFATTLCADLNLPKAFEPAIVFSIYEQVAAYRIALSGRKWIGTNPFQVKGTGLTLPTSGAGYIETMPPLDEVVRNTADASKLISFLAR
ncbi:unnamed protein product [Phytophthora lilii]|uniref:Unnamed protein product n=1 Tax=Phytophthora lilii TaxID=2077276 RepID=A0A9W6WN10_9STRA|nr:unnamed protein product [Phytophthora lilii]